MRDGLSAPPPIHLLFTGGTISMQRDAGGGRQRPGARAATALVRLARARCDRAVPGRELGALPGLPPGPDRLWALRERVGRDRVGPARPSGIVVTHGTDTLEETAYLLARTVPPAVPVAITGAMRTSSDRTGTARATCSTRAGRGASGSRGRGTMVVFTGRILAGRTAVKVDAIDLDAFARPTRRRSGRRRRTGAIHACGRAPQPAAARRGASSARVAIVPLVLGRRRRDARSGAARYDGVVVVAFGSGNMPPGAVPAIRRWLDGGSRSCWPAAASTGEVGAIYAFEGGGGRTAPAWACIPAGPRTPSQARMELVLCLSAGVPLRHAAA